MSAPKAVVFDMGRVLLEWDPSRLYERLLPDEVEREALKGRVDFDAMNLAGDLNGSLRREVETLASGHPEDAPLIRAWWEHWDEMCGPEIPGTREIVLALKAQGVAVAALTNFASDTWDHAMGVFPTLPEFETAVVSGKEQVMKPDPAIYALVETRLGLSGADLLFTDDKAENVAAAQARGWRGHVFETPEGLRKALAAEGLTV